MICYKGLDTRLDGPSVVLLGKFDGVHLGHQYLFHRAKAYAMAHGARCVVVTFDDHSFSNALLSLAREKKALCEEAGMDVLVELEFSAVCDVEAKDFLEDFLVCHLHGIHMVVGTDCTFGRAIAGNVEFLRNYQNTYGYTVDVVEKLHYNHHVISSAYIRECLEQNRLSSVNCMLGRPYHLSGVVVEGRKLGRTLGFPTANLMPSTKKILPPYGVYASRILLEDGRRFFGITNIGCKPTISEELCPNVETTLIDFSEDLYGKEIRVELMEFLRHERKFSSLEELKQQVLQDLSYVKEHSKKLEQGMNSMISREKQGILGDDMNGRKN
ncbi:MAG: riboflavin biosynthesis protein RibF [Lachnospiraceae bacterium]|nr:riboflavin biosynthesis protein RibF [Lachnospiraceae bacterium]